MAPGIGVPRSDGIAPRERLFERLDRHHRDGAATWLSAPGGAGKTSLVASWLRVRRHPALWLSLHAGCGDAATFLHELRASASGLARTRARGLPRLETAHLADIDAYARSFFRALGALLAGRLVLVLDNCPDLSAVGVMARLMRIALDEMVPKVPLVVTSRSDPPRTLARERLAGRLQVLDWSCLRLTIDECAAIAARDRAWSSARGRRIAALHAQTDGWAAGLVLLLAQGPGPPGADTRPCASDRALLFDYFASEVFERTGAAERAVLLTTSMLTRVDASLAVALSGRRDAASVLERLVRNNFFTLRVDGGARPAYELHVLFRDFLVDRAPAELGVAAWRRLLRSAARSLEAAGELDMAFDLWRQAGDAAMLQRFVLRRAQALLDQGRTQRLLHWLATLADLQGGRAAAASTLAPAVLHLQGMAWLPHDPAQALSCFERALQAARRTGDPARAVAAWCGAVESLVHGRTGGAAAVRWIDEFESLRLGPSLDEADELPARVSCAMFMLLMWVRPQHPQLSLWLSRVRALLHRAGPDTALPASVSHQYFFHQLLWEGDVDGARDTLRRLDACAAGTAPLHRVAWLVSAAHLHALTGGRSECLAAVEEGLRVGQEQGVHAWDLFLLAMPPIATLYADGDSAAADRHLKRLRQAMRPGRVVDELVFQATQAWRWVHDGAHARAERHLRAAIDLSERSMGAASRASFFPQLWRCGLAQVLGRSGRAEEARALMAQVLEKRDDNFVAPVFRYMADLMEAELGADEERSLAALRSALAFARGRGMLQHLAWCPGVMAALYARALAAGIETAYVRETIAALRLPAPPGCDAESWPWELRLILLDGFEVWVGGRRLVFATKAQKRPLALLKALATLPAVPGGAVGEDRLMSLFWPAAGRAEAAHALATALYRLRRLLGDELVVRRGGRLWLDPGRCWVDLWALERALERAAARGADAAADPAVTALWRDGPPDLGDEPWLSARLERARRRLAAPVVPRVAVDR